MSKEQKNIKMNNALLNAKMAVIQNKNFSQ